MNNLVQLDKSSHAFTTSLIIAEGVGLEHRAVIKLVDTHAARRTFTALQVRTRKAKGKGKPTRYFDLSEKQATFLITMMRNSEIVLDFKEALVDEFHCMRNELARIASNQTNEQWLEQRSSGKVSRRTETGVIKAFIEYAVRQGGSVKGCNMYYSNISKMENKALFIVEQRHPNLRDILGTSNLGTIQKADLIVARALQHGMDDQLEYKDIYLLAKDRVEQFAALIGVAHLKGLSGKNCLAKN